MRRGSSTGLSEYLRSRAELLRQQDQLLEEFVKRVVERLSPCAVLLFGSRARGDHMPYSDFDVAVIVGSAGDKLPLLEELRALKPRGFSLDLVILELEELNDPLVRAMLKGSLILHDSLGVEV